MINTNLPNFFLTFDDQPHKTRRKEILAKYPEVNELMVIDPWFKYDVAFRVLFQVAACYYIQFLSWPLWFLGTYLVVGTINHSLLLAIHEISHNMAFGFHHILANKFFGMFANLPIGVPVFTKFTYYHYYHHKNLGQVLDPDLPSLWETKIFTGPLGKLFFVFLQPFCYGIRPLILFPSRISFLEVINLLAQITFDLLIWFKLGPMALMTLFAGSLLGTGFHPISGHFISEHYMFSKNQETYSYYGPLNFITFNVGYHNEHHDFPNIPASLLPRLKIIAPEYYSEILTYNSWVYVIFKFIMDPNISLQSRVFREGY